MVTLHVLYSLAHIYEWYLIFFVSSGKGWSIIFAIVLSAAAIIGGVSKLVSGVVFTILGPIRHSDSFITHGDNSLVAGIAFIGAILLAIIFVIYLRRRTKRHVTLAS